VFLDRFLDDLREVLTRELEPKGIELRVDQKTQGKEDGTGLGLAIVEQVIEAHGGEVRFESAPGKGTTFTLSLPA
jgi:signal transduction histidine kinase